MEHLVGAAIMAALAVAVVVATVRGRRWYTYEPGTLGPGDGWSPGGSPGSATGWLSRPVTWLLAFVLVGALAVGGVFALASGAGVAGASTILLGAVAALAVGYLIGGIYLVARQRGHSTAMAFAESLTASGAVFLALVVVQLVALG